MSELKEQKLASFDHFVVSIGKDNKSAGRHDVMENISG